jgi:hypothetical protein
MNYLHSDLGSRDRGDVVEVTLTSGANVRVMSASDFGRYRQGQKHHYLGGLARQSPIRISLPTAGRWHAVVDMQGLKGSTKAGFRVLSAASQKPLPPIRQQTNDLETIAENFAVVGSATDLAEYDVFVSHASEDKEAFVRQFVDELQAQGLKVWYDEFALGIGSSLRRSIDDGIKRSRFGVVVLSKAFFSRSWPAYELDGLVTREIGGQQMLLPVWHGVSHDEVANYSPSLANKVARRTSDHTIREIAEEIAIVIAKRCVK